MEVTLDKVDYGGWPNCYRLANGVVELIVTTDVGPRIIRFGFVAQENEFREYPEMLGTTGGGEWRIYGGHRLWLAPEDRERTYQPDNSPIRLERGDGVLHLVQPIEAATGVQKEIDIRLSSDDARVVLTHRLRNVGQATVLLAPWALSVMAPGGVAIVPLPERRAHEETLLPTNTMTFWAYTDMTDSRWTWGRQYILLRQDPDAPSPQKAGFMVPDGWAAYARNDHLFVKTFQFRREMPYPDLGCSVEVFTNAEMLELETLGPLTNLPPAAAAEHVEEWRLFQGVPALNTEAAVEQSALPLIQRALRASA